MYNRESEMREYLILASLTNESRRKYRVLYALCKVDLHDLRAVMFAAFLSGQWTHRMLSLSR